MDSHFKKYHGLGNDYLVIDPNVFEVDLSPDSIRLICERHFGVGADGILYGPMGNENDLSVRIFNPDGSEAEKSGNGLRIFARYLYESKYVSSKNFKIETLGRTVTVEIKDESANLIKIDMGTITFNSAGIPAKGQEREVVDEKLEIHGVTYNVTCLSIGNPHCVIPMQVISEQKARRLGPLIEYHDMFPNRINMQLLKVIDRSNIEIQIWERGAGYTLASGSSSCAAAGAAQKLGFVDNRINVNMPGGGLLVEIAPDGHIHLTGPVEKVFEGRFNADLADRVSI